MVRALPWTAMALGVAAHGAATDASGMCHRLRVPQASIVHEFVHLASFENIHEQAMRFVADWQLPSYKTPDVARQLLDVFADMAAHRVSEALVNLTRDHSLAYEVSVAVGGKSTTERLEIPVERPFDETMRDFCARFEIEDCAELRGKVYPLAVRDWGCLDGDDATPTESTSDSSYAASSTPLAEDVAPRRVGPSATPRHVIRLNSGVSQPSLPVLRAHVDGELHNVTLRADQDLELQAALLCRQWNTPASECAKVVATMRELTRDHAAFNGTSPPPFAPTSPSGLALHVSSPVSTRLYPISERVYFEGEWIDSETSQRVEGRRTVCLYSSDNDQTRPAICGPFPPEEMWYFARDTLSEGYHIMLFAEPPDDSTTTVPMPPKFLAARHFWVVTPTVKLLDVRLRALQSTVFVVLTIETTAFDLLDPEFRVCALVDDDLLCFEPRLLHIESVTGALPQRRTVFRAALFDIRPGHHTTALLLVDSFNNAFAHSVVATFSVNTAPNTTFAPRDPAYFFEPPSARHIKRPTTCPPRLASAGLSWICDLWRHEWGRFSQNGEDGVLQSIFHNVGATNQFYVEFGTEDGRECNTRYLREVHAWRGLLLDGSHANTSINLHQAWISPENINDLFATHDVPREFDLLSVDVDFNDYWILDAIDRARFSPRVITVEVNSHVPPHEPRVVKYKGPTARWDGRSAYFGVSVGAIHLWGRRNGYSLVYCESRGVNCFLVRDDVLASVARGDEDEDASLVVSHVLRAEDLHASPNFFGRNASYPWPAHGSGIVEEWAWLDDQ